MSHDSEFSLVSFTKENAPLPVDVNSVLMKRVNAVTVLINYWVSVREALENGVDCSVYHAVAELLYKIDLLKMQERAVLDLKTTATMLVNANLFVESTFLTLMELHRKIHYFLIEICPVLKKCLIMYYQAYVEKTKKIIITKK